MLFPNWTGWKTVKLVLSLAGSFVGALTASGVIPSTLGADISGTLAAFVALVVAISGTNAGPPMLVQRTPAVVK